MIPIYRAKPFGADEWVEGYYLPHTMWDKYHYIVEGFDEYTCGYPCEETNALVNEIRIDVATLAIHLPGMEDANGHKIFASLNSDGKGGDIVNYIDNEGRDSESTVTYNELVICPFEYMQPSYVKIVGIYE